MQLSQALGILVHRVVNGPIGNRDNSALRGGKLGQTIDDIVNLLLNAHAIVALAAPASRVVETGMQLRIHGILQIKRAQIVASVKGQRICREEIRFHDESRFAHVLDLADIIANQSLARRASNHISIHGLR